MVDSERNETELVPASVLSGGYRRLLFLLLLLRQRRIRLGPGREQARVCVLPSWAVGHLRTHEQPIDDVVVINDHGMIFVRSVAYRHQDFSGILVLLDRRNQFVFVNSITIGQAKSIRFREFDCTNVVYICAVAIIIISTLSTLKHVSQRTISRRSVLLLRREEGTADGRARTHKHTHSRLIRTTTASNFNRW